MILLQEKEKTMTTTIMTKMGSSYDIEPHSRSRIHRDWFLIQKDKREGRGKKKKNKRNNN